MAQVNRQEVLSVLKPLGFDDRDLNVNSFGNVQVSIARQDNSRSHLEQCQLTVDAVKALRDAGYSIEDQDVRNGYPHARDRNKWVQWPHIWVNDPASRPARSRSSVADSGRLDQLEAKFDRVIGLLEQLEVVEETVEVPVDDEEFEVVDESEAI